MRNEKGQGSACDPLYCGCAVLCMRGHAVFQRKALPRRNLARARRRWLHYGGTPRETAPCRYGQQELRRGDVRAGRSMSTSQTGFPAYFSSPSGALPGGEFSCPAAFSALYPIPFHTGNNAHPYHFHSNDIDRRPVIQKNGRPAQKNTPGRAEPCLRFRPC